MESSADLPVADVKFEHEWKVWENFEMKQWKESLEEVASFKDPFTFFAVWDKIPHSNPMNFFARREEGKTEKSTVNLYESRHGKMKINTLSVFRSPIWPEWEDKMCKNGGLF